MVHGHGPSVAITPPASTLQLYMLGYVKGYLRNEGPCNGLSHQIFR